MASRESIVPALGLSSIAFQGRKPFFVLDWLACLSFLRIVRRCWSRHYGIAEQLRDLTRSFVNASNLDEVERKEYESLLERLEAKNRVRRLVASGVDFRA